MSSYFVKGTYQGYGMQAQFFQIFIDCAPWVLHEAIHSYVKEKPGYHNGTEVVDCVIKL